MAPVMTRAVLLVYWTWRCDLQGRLFTDMEKLDGIVLEVNIACTYIAHSCLDPMHSLTATQLVSYPVGKGKILMLNTLKDWAFLGC